LESSDGACNSSQVEINLVESLESVEMKLIKTMEAGADPEAEVELTENTQIEANNNNREDSDVETKTVDKEEKVSELEGKLVEDVTDDATVKVKVVATANEEEVEQKKEGTTIEVAVIKPEIEIENSSKEDSAETVKDSGVETKTVEKEEKVSESEGKLVEDSAEAEVKVEVDAIESQEGVEQKKEETTVEDAVVKPYIKTEIENSSEEQVHSDPAATVINESEKDTSLTLLKEMIETKSPVIPIESETEDKANSDHSIISETKEDVKINKEEKESVLSESEITSPANDAGQSNLVKRSISGNGTDDTYSVTKNCTDIPSNQREVDSPVEIKEKSQKLHYQIDQIMALNLPVGLNTNDDMLDDLMAIAKASGEYNNNNTLLEPHDNFSATTETESSNQSESYGHCAESSTEGKSPGNFEKLQKRFEVAFPDGVDVDEDALSDLVAVARATEDCLYSETSETQKIVIFENDSKLPEHSITPSCTRKMNYPESLPNEEEPSRDEPAIGIVQWDENLCREGADRTETVALDALNAIMARMDKTKSRLSASLDNSSEVEAEELTLLEKLASAALAMKKLSEMESGYQGL